MDHSCRESQCTFFWRGMAGGEEDANVYFGCIHFLLFYLFSSFSAFSSLLVLLLLLVFFFYISQGFHILLGS